jgi:hypothetical protein
VKESASNYVTTGPVEVATSLDEDNELQIYINVDTSPYLWFSRDEAVELVRHITEVFKLSPSDL